MKVESAQGVNFGSASAYILRTESSRATQEAFLSAEEAEKTLNKRKLHEAGKGALFTIPLVAALGIGIKILTDSEVWTQAEFIDKGESTKAAIGITLIVVGTQGRIVLDSTIGKIYAINKQIKKIKSSGEPSE